MPRYHSSMEFHKRTIRQLATMICGNFPDESTVFVYRSSSRLTQFFEDCDTDYTHGGQTRDAWVADVLIEILSLPQSKAPFPPDTFLRVIQELMDQADAVHEDASRPKALSMLNATLRREGYEAYYAKDRKCYLRHVSTSQISEALQNPHRPFSAEELGRRQKLIAYLDKASEDELIGDVLLPLFRQLGFHRVSAAGHEDKALEYVRDIWMRFRLPTQHQLYFGLQAKIGKIDAAGRTEKGNANVAELLNQVTMMLSFEIFDPETNKKHLPDHAFIVSGGTITKAARNWLAGALDKSKRSQLIFMDRDDILNLYVVANLPLPNAALSSLSVKDDIDDDIPF